LVFSQSHHTSPITFNPLLSFSSILFKALQKHSPHYNNPYSILFPFHLSFPFQKAPFWAPSSSLLLKSTLPPPKTHKTTKLTTFSSRALPLPSPRPRRCRSSPSHGGQPRPPSPSIGVGGGASKGVEGGMEEKRKKERKDGRMDMAFHPAVCGLEPALLGLIIDLIPLSAYIVCCVLFDLKSGDVDCSFPFWSGYCPLRPFFLLPQFLSSRTLCRRSLQHPW